MSAAEALLLAGEIGLDLTVFGGLKTIVNDGPLLVDDIAELLNFGISETSNFISLVGEERQKTANASENQGRQGDDFEDKLNSVGGFD